MIQVKNLSGEVIAEVEGCDTFDADFSFLDLQFADFRGWDLSNASFASADLHGADFTGADLEYSDIADALDLSDTVFDDARMPYKSHKAHLGF